jgi:hypothetical protein
MINGSNILTHSREQSYRTCQRKHYFAYELGLRPKYNADPLRKGGVFHQGIQEIKEGRTPEYAAKAVRAIYAEIECPPWLQPYDMAIECETVAAMVEGWGRRWAGDMICEYVAVEKSFRLPIINPITGKPTPIWESSGKIDAMVRLPDSRLALMEHKTVSESISPDSDYWQRLKIDNQISRYVLAARASGFDVQTTVFDVVRKPGTGPKELTQADSAAFAASGEYHGRRFKVECPGGDILVDGTPAIIIPGKKANAIKETVGMFGARLLADMAARPDFYFQRCEIPRLESDLVAYQAEAWQMQRNIRQSQLDEREFGIAAWPRNTAQCLNMGKCPYMDLCLGHHGNITNDATPQGFRRVENLHEEL